MEPWQSWAMVLLGGVAVYYYYTTQLGRRAKVRQTPIAHERSGVRRREDSSGKQRISGVTGDTSGSDPRLSLLEDGDQTPTKRRDKNKAKKPRAGQATSPSHGDHDGVAANVAAGVDDDDDDNDGRDEGIGNKEFAQRLAGLKSGASLAPPANASIRQRTTKQSRANSTASHMTSSETNGPESSSLNPSTTSSNTGGDIEDDQSLTRSPLLAASSIDQQAGPSSSVSDMLEAPAPGPAILRVTEPTQPARVPRVHQQNAPEVRESKKQRQNRKKVEEKKAAREQAEKERRELLEKQLRTAREAEGRPAKNGVAPAKAPSSSAWSSGGSREAAAASQAEAPSHTALLDTFDSAKTAASPTTTASKSKAWESNLPSEEEQMRLINEMDPDAGWSTVAKGKRSKRKAAGAEGSSAGNESSETESRSAQAAKFEAPETGNTAASSPSGNVSSNVGDSDWSVV